MSWSSSPPPKITRLQFLDLHRHREHDRLSPTITDKRLFSKHSQQKEAMATTHYMGNRINPQGQPGCGLYTAGDSILGTDGDISQVDCLICLQLEIARLRTTGFAPIPEDFDLSEFLAAADDEDPNGPEGKPPPSQGDCSCGIPASRAARLCTERDCPWK